jgi:hypothetical protein
VKFAFIAAREVAFPVSAICRVLGVTNSGFYAWKKRPKPERVLLDARLAATVAAVHHRSRRTYGSPRVYRELKARGVRVGKKRVERLMRENGLQGRSKRRYKRATDSRHGGPIAPNLLARRRARSRHRAFPSLRPFRPRGIGKEVGDIGAQAVRFRSLRVDAETGPRPGNCDVLQPSRTAVPEAETISMLLITS